MKKIILSLGILIIIFASNAYSNELVYKDKTFTARVGNVRLQSELIAQGKTNGDQVSATVPAVIFNKPIVINDVRTVNKSYGKEIDFLIAYYKANIEGDKEKIISFWHPSEKAAIAKNFNDPELFKENQERITNNPGITIHGVIKQKTIISIITGTDFVYGISLKPKEGKLYLTNIPDNDLELAIVEASFM